MTNDRDFRKFDDLRAPASLAEVPVDPNLAASEGRHAHRFEQIQAENERLRAENATLKGEDDVASDPALMERKRSRKPFGTMIQKMFWPPRKGYHRHWFNDEPGRIDAAKSAGYEHVMHNGKAVSMIVSKTPTGGGKLGYLMEIPSEWFEEDMARNQEAVDRTYKSIYTGTLGQKPSDGRYIPSVGIKIDSR